jgi:regulator of protease activity HflC (stomatin/prohibitin superfamily)
MHTPMHTRMHTPMLVDGFALLLRPFGRTIDDAMNGRGYYPQWVASAQARRELVMIVIDLLVAALGLGAAWFALSARIIKQYERGLVFRFGRVLESVRGPGLTMILPGVDRLRKVNMQIVTMPVPAQEGITRDNVTVRVDAVVYFKVEDPVRAIVTVQDYLFAVLQVAQTSLRSMIGKSELDDLLSNRERLNQGLELMIDSPALSWGIHIDRVEIKDVALPESMKRSMSRQAEAERERRARIITAEGELQASHKLAEAASVMADTPAALQLRLLETVVEVAAEKNSTLVLPFPVELLRFLERAPAGPVRDPDRTPGAERPAADRPTADLPPAEAPAAEAGEAPAAIESAPAPATARELEPSPDAHPGVAQGA